MASVHTWRSKSTGVVSHRVRFRIDGVQRQESFPDPETAYEFKRLVDQVGGAQAVRILEARLQSGVSMPSLREWTYRYLDPQSGLLTGVEDGTRGGYRRAAENSFLPILGDYPVDGIEASDVGRWLTWQEKQPSNRQKDRLIAAKTIRNYHGILSAVMGAAVTAKLREDNPAFKTRLPRGVKREPVFLSPAEFATLMHFMPDYYSPLFYFMAGTGLRWGEATAVQWGDINTTSTPATVRVERAWKKADSGGPILKHPKSSKSRRTVSMHRDLVIALGDRGPVNELLFKGPESGTHLWYGRIRTRIWLPAVAKAMDPELCVAAGLEPLTKAPTIHDLRHSHASWLIAAGLPLPYIQARLGHESITTTVGVYGHLVPEAHQQMATAIETTLAASAGQINRQIVVLEERVASEPAPL